MEQARNSCAIVASVVIIVGCGSDNNSSESTVARAIQHELRIEVFSMLDQDLFFQDQELEELIAMGERLGVELIIFSDRSDCDEMVEGFRSSEVSISFRKGRGKLIKVWPVDDPSR